MPGRPKLAPKTTGKLTLVPYWRPDPDGPEVVMPESWPCGQCATCEANAAAGDGLTVPCPDPINPRESRAKEYRPTRWRGRTRLRVPGPNGRGTGRVVEVERWAASKAAAESAVKTAVQERLGGMASVDTATVETVARQWFTEKIDGNADLSPATVTVYASALRRHVYGTELGARLPADVTPADIERRLQAIAKGSGVGMAKTTRAVLSKVFGYAKRSGLCAENVVRDAERTATPRDAKVSERDHERALEWPEAVALCWTTYRDRHRVIGDVVAFMLASGVRIGECLALRWADVDLDAGSVRITGTIARVGGELRRLDPKTEKSRRVVVLPPRTLALLRRRKRDRVSTDAASPVFPADPLPGEDATGTVFLDPANTIKRVRKALAAVTLDDGSSLDWAVPHTFRRTAITWWMDAGIPIRKVADLAGHTDISMTLRVYAGRGGDVAGLPVIMAKAGRPRR